MFQLRLLAPIPATTLTGAGTGPCTLFWSPYAGTDMVTQTPAPALGLSAVPTPALVLLAIAKWHLHLHSGTGTGTSCDRG